MTRLDGLPGSALDPRAVADEATARAQIMNRSLDGALLIDPAGTTWAAAPAPRSWPSAREPAPPPRDAR